MKKAYIDTSIALLAAKLGYWQFVALSREWHLVLPTVTMRELRNMPRRASRILLTLMDRGVISVECTGGAKTFDSFALRVLRPGAAAILSLDRRLLRTYYKGSNPPVRLCRNQFRRSGH